jgi:D-serine deaminase-like pyridoxal phosphate-dependent protein
MPGIVSRPLIGPDRVELYDQATADLEPPLAVVDLDAFDANADDLLRRAGGVPIRVVSKSLRCRFLLERALARPGFRGVMSYALAEALWLHGDSGRRDLGRGLDTDILVAYPTTDRPALRSLAASESARRLISVMVDSAEHLDFIDAVLGSGHPEIRVCLELDVSWLPLGRVRVGTLRSPQRTPAEAAALAAAIVARPGFKLVGVMGYEGQIAGLGDNPPGAPLKAAVLRLAQSRSAAELRARRTEAVRLICELTSLEFVNGGGTGSLESTSRDPSVTELAAGSGLVGPTLFDAYRSFRPRPALLYALPVVRRPAAGAVTLFSGGYVASGTGTRDRLPSPFWPKGLRLTRTEGAGEVQTPVRGAAADRLRLGDRVWMRHAKGGELAERFPQYHVIEPGSGEARPVPTYRGEGQSFRLVRNPVKRAAWTMSGNPRRPRRAPWPSRRCRCERPGSSCCSWPTSRCGWRSTPRCRCCCPSRCSRCTITPRPPPPCPAGPTRCCCRSSWRPGRSRRCSPTP